MPQCSWLGGVDSGEGEQGLGRGGGGPWPLPELSALCSILSNVR